MELNRRGMMVGLGLAASFAAPANAKSKSTDIKDLQAAIENAIQADGVLQLAAGDYSTPGIRIEGPLRLQGVPGRTRIISPGGGPIVVIADAAHVTLSGLTFVGDTKPVPDDNKGAALVMASKIARLVVEDCTFTTSTLIGLRLEGCGGRVTSTTFTDLDQAIFALDSANLSIETNVISDVANNGILVWTSAQTEDGTQVRGNRIERVRATAGGTGENGNGVNVFKAGGVIVSENRIIDCAFSAVRNNSGANCQIINNTVSKLGETALYCEFGFEGAVISGNIVDGCALGISITNFNDGGRLAVCAGNVIKDSQNGGIAAEADTVVTGNVIDSAGGNAISLGWGEFSRNLSATSNVIRNSWRGIVFSTVQGAGAVAITGNRIDGCKAEAIAGMDHETVVTGDFGKPGAEAPAQGLISNNLVT